VSTRFTSVAVRVSQSVSEAFPGYLPEFPGVILANPVMCAMNIWAKMVKTKGAVS
jgi:hypothetical protein